LPHVPRPLRRARQHQAARHRARVHRLTKSPGGASRHGFHRQYPLRYRAATFHARQPPIHQRLLMPALHALSAAIDDFTHRLTACLQHRREGVDKTKHRATPSVGQMKYPTTSHVNPTEEHFNYPTTSHVRSTCKSTRKAKGKSKRNKRAKRRMKQAAERVQQRESAKSQSQQLHHPTFTQFLEDHTNLNLTRATNDYRETRATPIRMPTQAVQGISP
jgi:hypothetical protein